MTIQPPEKCPMCDANRFEGVHWFKEPPEGELRYDLDTDRPYSRKLFRCQACGHFCSVHDMDDSALYLGEYVNAIYGAEGLETNFNKIMGLPEEQSDNRQRVKRVDGFCRDRKVFEDHDPTVLDIGSGLAVFPAAMRQAGWHCTALDPDPRSAKHACDIAKVNGIEGDFMSCPDLGRFDLITLNKVLEHTPDPVAMLEKTLGHVHPHGIVYVELPDGEAALDDSPLREEFFLDHPHIFSAASMALLAWRAGLEVLTLTRLRDPSGKYTLFAFLRPPTANKN